MSTGAGGEVYHEGELAVQARAGVRAQAMRVGGIVRSEIPAPAARFIEGRNFAVVGALRGERVWAGLLVGRFRTADQGRTLDIEATLGDDPVASLDGPLGLLAIDPATRRRMRLNGIAREAANGWQVSANEVYSNCPQHITPRAVDEAAAALAERRVTSRGSRLSRDQSAWIETADTWFIATTHPHSGADVSHRGGRVRVEDDRSLAWDDYDGNMMFNTLGNLEIDDRAGLLWIDWEGRRTLQATGHARVQWSGGGRIVRFVADEIVQSETAAPSRAEKMPPSPL